MRETGGYVWERGDREREVMGEIEGEGARNTGRLNVLISQET